MNNQYRVIEKKFQSLEGGIFYHYIIEQRRFKFIGLQHKIFWKWVIDESKTKFSRPNGGKLAQFYPYQFNTRKEADEFIINHLIGKVNWRNNIIDSILK